MQCIKRFLITLIFFSSGQIFAAEYYVSPGGTDSNPGTIAQPWNSISKANKTLRAGDIVYIRAGTYHESINPANSGTQGNPIVFKAYEGDTVILKGPGAKSSEAVIAIGYPGQDAGWRGADYIVVDGFVIDPTFASYGACIYGKNTEYNTIRNCHFQCSTPTEPRNHGVLIGSAKWTLIENNEFTGSWNLGIIMTARPKFNIVRGNRIIGPHGSCIDIQTSFGDNQAMLIENNVLLGSQAEDGIQFEPDYSVSFDHGTMRGIIIRGNVIGNHAENGIDLKGAAHVVIEGNIIYGCRGDNDGSGNLGGGTGGIMKGDIGHTQAHNILIRKNFIYDNLGGISIHNRGWVVVNNTIIGNNRSHLGPDCSASQIETAPTDYLRRFPGLVGVIITEPYAPTFDLSMIKNNIIGGNHQGEISVRLTADLDQAEIDGNLYFSSDTPMMAAVQKGWNWEKIDHEELKRRFQSINGPVGKEANSRVVNVFPIELENDSPTGSGDYSIALTQNSTAIDAGLALTTCTSAGSGSTVPVINARCFSDGYGIVSGDTIIFHVSGTSAIVKSINTDQQELELDRQLSWQMNEGISLIYHGNGPDIGAFESNYVSNNQVDELKVKIKKPLSKAMVVPVTTTLTAEVEGGEDPYIYSWSLNNDIISNVANFSHVFNNSGDYVLVLSVSDQSGQSVTDTLKIITYMPLALSTTTSVSSQTVPAEWTLSAIPSGGIEPYEIEWSWNGKVQNTGTSVIRAINSEERHTIYVKLQDESAQIILDTISVQLNRSLNLVITSTISEAYLPVNSTLSAVISGGAAPFEYEWFSNGSKIDNQQSFVYSFPNDGVYTIKCIVKDSNNNQVERELTITVKQPFTVDILTGDLSGIAPFNIAMEVTPVGGKSPYQYKWDLGNGEIYNSSKLTYLYDTPGTYTVNLVATDSENSIINKQWQVSVTETPSIAVIDDIYFTETSSNIQLPRLISEYWTDMQIKLNEEISLKDLAFIDISVSSKNVDLTDDRGGRFSSEHTYIISLSISDQTVWCKENNSSSQWTELSGKLGQYVDARSNFYMIDEVSRTISIRFKPLQSCIQGLWFTEAIAYDTERLPSNLYSGQIFVQGFEKTPRCEINILGRTPEQVKVQLNSTILLAHIPDKLKFIDSSGRVLSITLQGNLPGRIFTGLMDLDTNIKNGLGQFNLEQWTLIDAEGNVGHQIIKGRDLLIDKTPPRKPENLIISK